MVIVEGPDGSGKTTLVEKLAHDLDVPIAARVVSQQTRPMEDLKRWTEVNLEGGFQQVIFDRHRLISDPIYRSVLGNHNPSLYDPDWLMRKWTQLVDIRPLVIFCLPPLEVVKKNLQGDEANAVVSPYTDQLYYSYCAFYAAVGRALGNVMLFDYTNPRVDFNYRNLTNVAKFWLRTKGGIDD